MGRDPGPPPVPVLLGNAVILPSRSKVYRKDTNVAVFVAVVLSFRLAHELKASFLASS